MSMSVRVKERKKEGRWFVSWQEEILATDCAFNSCDIIYIMILLFMDSST